LNLRRILGLAAAFGAVGAAAAASMVAAAFALYALVESHLGPAGGAAVVAVVLALIAGIVALLAVRKAAPRSRKDAPPAALLDRAVGLAKERPLIALGAAAAITALAVRNPALINTVVSAFIGANTTRRSK
jgi:hypothetical protein